MIQEVTGTVVHKRTVRLLRCARRVEEQGESVQTGDSAETCDGECEGFPPDGENAHGNQQVTLRASRRADEIFERDRMDKRLQ
jgi:hypothetical protein